MEVLTSMSIIIPVAIGIIVTTVIYLFKYGLKEKTYEENAAEQKKKYGSKLKPKYPQQKKTVKAPTKEKSTEKKSKVTVQASVGVKDVKKSEPPSTPSVDKPDGNANVKKKPEKLPQKPIPSGVSAAEKSQPLSSPSGKPNTEPVVKAAVNGSQEDVTNVPDVLKNLPACKNDTNNNIATSKSSLTESTDTEDTDSSYNNDRTTSVSYYNSNVAANGEKLSKKPPSTTGSDTETSQKSKPSDATSGAKKEKKSNDVKPAKSEDKAKPKKNDEKLSKNIKEQSNDKVKPPPSPSKNKKPEEKSKNPEIVVVNSFASLNAVPSSGDEKDTKVKNDKKIDDKSSQGVGLDQNVDKKCADEKDSVNSVMKPEKIQPHKKASTSIGGKTSPVQNGKNHGSNANKSSKRHATEVKASQKMTNENDGPVNVTSLISRIAKAELSHIEIQNLIDTLLNKQQDCVIDNEWIEGSRGDPMVKLKKQLAEKEKLLLAEQEAHQAIQSKLKELRTELNVEKHNSRQLEETLKDRQVELQSLNVKLQTALEEKQNFAKQIQQLQSKLNEERMIMHSLKEENSKTESSLKQELLSQRQQLEVHIIQLNEQHQQAIVTLESQLGQIAGQLQEQEAASAQLSEELRECMMQRDQAVAENRNLRQAATATQELVIQLEEARGLRTEIDHLYLEVNRLNNELKSASDQLSRRNSEIEKFNSTVQNMKIENQELLKENARINEQINNAYSEKKQLQIENEKLKEQLNQSNTVLDIEQLENELNKYKTLVNEKIAEITELNKQINEVKASLQQSLSLNAELQKKTEAVKEIEDNFKKQLKKNDEIKVKEREELINRLKGGFLPDSELHSSVVNVEDAEWFNNVEKWLKMVAASSQPKSASETVASSSPQRQTLNSTSTATSPVEDKLIPDAGQKNMLYALEKQNTKLQSMLSHYKDIICDTEGMLNRLEQQVKQQENQWIKQIQALESEVESLSREKDLLSSQVKMQNGCVKEDEHNIKHDSRDKHTILSTNSTTVTNS